MRRDHPTTDTVTLTTLAIRTKITMTTLMAKHNHSISMHKQGLTPTTLRINNIHITTTINIYRQIQTCTTNTTTTRTLARHQ